MLEWNYDEQGLKLTESYEGFRNAAYQDVVGVWTIGFGHTGPEVKPGLTITREQGEILLRADIAAAASCVRSAVTYPISQAQFDALVDFTFNLGCGAFLRSTLLRDINAGNIQAAADQFMLWANAGGKRVDGLVRRRTEERALFLQE